MNPRQRFALQVRRETIGDFKAAEQRQSVLRSRPRGRTWLQMTLFPEQCPREGFSSARALWMQLEAQVDLPEMGVACEDVGDVKILHDHHAREINKRNVGLILVLLPESPGGAELVGRKMSQHISAGVDSSQNRVNEPLSVLDAGRRKGK